MTDQSVIDIKFKDVLAKDLKGVLGKTLDELTKELIKSSDAALGVSGSLTNLGIIPSKDGRIGGIRFAVDSAYKEDVQQALRDTLGRHAERAGVKQVASVLSNSGMKAFSEPYIRLPNDDPKYAKSVFDFIDSAGGEVLWAEKYKDYIALRARMPHSHIKGNALSTMQQFAQIRQDADNMLFSRVKNAENIRKEDIHTMSEADIAAQEEIRKRVGGEKDEKSKSASEIEQTSYYNKSLLYLAGIGESVRRIFGVVSKLYDNALKSTYTAQASNVNPDKLRQLEYALQGFGFDKATAGTALGLISGGLMNPLQLNENLVDTLAPVMGRDTAGMVNDMLLGGGDSLSALANIMESARKKVAAGGLTGTGDAGKAFSEVYGQLKAAGGGLEQLFQAYMKATQKANAQGWQTFEFSDFLELFPAKGTAISADAALQKAFLETKIKAGAANKVYENTYNPAKPYRNFKYKGKPYDTEEDFLEALNSFGFDISEGTDFLSLEPALKELLKSKTLTKEETTKLKRLLDTVQDMKALRAQTGAPYFANKGYDLPFSFLSEDAFIGPAVERAAQGLTGLSGSGGINYYDYTTNNSSGSGASELSRAQIDMNLRINGKDAGVFPIDVGLDNYTISGEITGV